MSVDDRIRSAFAETDDTWENGVDEVLRAVRRRHTRGIAVRRGAASLAAAAAVVTGAVLVTGHGPGGEAAPDPVGPPSPPTVSESPSFGVTVLQGRWRTTPLDENALRGALAAAGDEAFADSIVSGLPAAPFRLVWDVDRGTAQLRAVSGPEVTVLDELAVVVEADTVTMTPRFAEGATVHRFVIADDELRLTFVSTSEGGQDGVPAAVWQRLLYDAFAFGGT